MITGFDFLYKLLKPQYLEKSRVLVFVCFVCFLCFFCFVFSCFEFLLVFL